MTSFYLLAHYIYSFLRHLFSYTKFFHTQFFFFLFEICLTFSLISYHSILTLVIIFASFILKITSGYDLRLNCVFSFSVWIELKVAPLGFFYSWTLPLLNRHHNSYSLHCFCTSLTREPSPLRHSMCNLGNVSSSTITLLWSPWG